MLPLLQIRLRFFSPPSVVFNVFSHLLLVSFVSGPEAKTWLQFKYLLFSYTALLLQDMIRMNGKGEELVPGEQGGGLFEAFLQMHALVAQVWLLTPFTAYYHRAY